MKRKDVTNLKVRKDSIVTLLLLLNIFELYCFNDMVLKVFKIFSLGVATVYLCKYNKITYDSLKKGKFIFFYIVAIMISSYFNYGLTVKFGTALVQCYFIGTLFFLIYSRYNCLNQFFKETFCFLIFICVLNDCFIILHINFLDYYLLGNKFNVAYAHMMIIYLYFENYYKQHKRMIGILLTLWAIVIAILTDTSTGVIGICLLFALCSLPEHIQIKLSKPLIPIILLVISDTILLGSSSILENEYVRNFISNILNRSLDLTGRIPIYKILYQLFIHSPIFGYGYSNDIFSKTIGYGNAQNGFLEIVINFGVLGAIAFSLFLVSSLININKNTWPTLAIIYTFIVLSSVEITFGNIFILLLVILITANCQDNNKGITMK